MTTVRITVEARDILFRPAMFGSRISLGQRAQIAEGVTLRNDGGIEQRAGDIPGVFRFTLEILEPRVEGVLLALIAAWLYDRLKGHVHPERGDERVVIERTEVDLEEGEITRVLTEKITSETSPKPKTP